VVIPTLHESSGIAATLDALLELMPPPSGVVLSDGGGKHERDTVKAAAPALSRLRQAGVSTRIVDPLSEHDLPGRARQINRGVEAAPPGCYVVILHADTTLPLTAIRAVRTALSRKEVAAGGFWPRITSLRRSHGRDGRPQSLRLMSLHNATKTYYLPLLFRPRSFVRQETGRGPRHAAALVVVDRPVPRVRPRRVRPTDRPVPPLPSFSSSPRGLRILFGDQAMFARRNEVLATPWGGGPRRGGGLGLDPRLEIMEDADLCLRLHGEGLAPFARGRRRILQLGPRVPGPAETSGRRIEALGQVRATCVHFVIGLAWAVGRACGSPTGGVRRLAAALYSDGAR